MLLDDCPCFIPASIKAGVTPGLVRVLRRVRASPELDGGFELPIDIDEACLAPLLSLSELTHYDMKHGKRLWRPLIDAGILPVLLTLHKRGDATASGPFEKHLLLLSTRVLLCAPPKHAGELGSQLLGEIARLANDTSPLATREPASVLLLDIVHERPELVPDGDRWGIEDAVQGLTRHADPEIAGKAKPLKCMLACMRMVSSTSTTHNWSSAVLLPVTLYQ
jgi:hypothetical protein